MPTSHIVNGATTCTVPFFNGPCRIGSASGVDAALDVRLMDVSRVTGPFPSQAATAGLRLPPNRPIEPGNASLARYAASAAWDRLHTDCDRAPDYRTQTRDRVSMLPFTDAPAPPRIFPATRTTNRSTTPWS